jgi:hypothetical protein
VIGAGSTDGPGQGRERWTQQQGTDATLPRTVTPSTTTAAVNRMVAVATAVPVVVNVKRAGTSTFDAQASSRGIPELNATAWVPWMIEAVMTTWCA